MAFSALFEFVPGDEAGKGRWLLEHYIEHRRFADALLAQTPSVASLDYPIQRMENAPDWLAAHQKMTGSVNAGLGLGAAPDFERLDFEDENALHDWFVRHSLWHKASRDSLGL